MKPYLLLLGLLSAHSGMTQTYFPPLSGNEWETTDLNELGWCQENVDSLYSYLESRNSKSFIVLVGGKIALEAYFNGHDAQAFWYWASAGKTIVAVLTGIAQEEGLLDINDPVSEYLGPGWTDCETADEEQRTIRHQLSMISTFNDSPLYWDCTTPDCFQCDGDAGTQWHYHNGVYRRLHDVLESAVGTTNNLYTTSRIGNLIGMNGLWSGDQLFVSRTRDMARFGLLTLNNFVWDETVVLADQEYIQDMITPSQNLNESYGYLWWLNGQSSFYLPLNPVLQMGSIVPSAPADMYAGMGANDQRVYVVPSMDMVVIRMGETAYESQPSLSAFDEELWQLIMNLPCSPTSAESLLPKNSLSCYPNPSTGTISVRNADKFSAIEIFDLSGKKVDHITPRDASAEIRLSPGTYLLKARMINGIILTEKLVVL